MKINAIDRNSISYDWVTSESLLYDEMYITKSGRICLVTIQVDNDDCMAIIFLDNFGLCHKIPYHDKTERFARLHNVNLTLEYYIDRIDAK